jgi:hypothetical protein
MRTIFIRMFAAGVCILLLAAFSEEKKVNSASVPIVLDHNRMLVQAEFPQKDGGWLDARLWVDTGNPDFFMSEAFARKLGIDLSQSKDKIVDGQLEVPPPAGVRIGGMPLNFEGVKSYVVFAPAWLFSVMHNDANLPSTVLKRYQVIFDYPKHQLTLAEPGNLKPRGERSAAAINPETGIVQIDAVIDGENLSFALDNGASYSFVSGDLLEKLSKRHPEWPRIIGATGCANMWGWPMEAKWPVMRLPELKWGSVALKNIGIVGLPNVFGEGKNIGDWYSQKTARRVDGFFGPNMFKAFRVEIDYANSAVYFEKGTEFDSNDMDIVGLTLRQQDDGSYQVIGIVSKDGKPAVDGIEPGDILVQVDNLKTTGTTMGTVVDALRGKPGDVRIIELDRNGKRSTIKATAQRLL